MRDETFYRITLDHMYEGVYFVTLDRTITFWNKGAEMISGFSAEEVVGSKCFDNILNHVDGQGTQLCVRGCPLHATMVDGVSREASVYLHHKEGQRIRVDVRTIPLTEEDRIIGAVEVFKEHVEQQLFMTSEQLSTASASLEDLKTLALYDQMTGLPNRRHLENMLKLRFSEWEVSGIPFAVVFGDIDHFKYFNDTHGHQMGDRVLKLVGRSLMSAMRKSDIVGRWGGEEFVAILSPAGKAQAVTISSRMRMLVENSPLRLYGQELHVTASFGATVCTTSDTLESILERADALMYESKEKGRNTVTLG